MGTPLIKSICNALRIDPSYLSVCLPRSQHNKVAGTDVRCFQSALELARRV